MDSVPNAASSALSELLEVSPQVDVSIIIERDGGRLIASAPTSSDRVAGQLGDLCSRVLDAAERSRTELGREPIAQVEVATADGHLFVVADARWVVAAVTASDPTVGLVFYDLKTALRSVREAAGTSGATTNGAAPSGSAATRPLVDVSTETPADTAADAGEQSAAADSDEPSTPAQSRWRRKKS